MVMKKQTQSPTGIFDYSDDVAKSQKWVKYPLALRKYSPDWQQSSPTIQSAYINDTAIGRAKSRMAATIL